MKTTSNQQVMLGQPLDYPYVLVSTLKQFFGGISGIKSAYLACIQYADSSLSPKLLIGLDTTHDVEKVVCMFEEYMCDKPVFNEPLEFVSANSEPFSGYFSRIEPIYKKIKN